MTLTPLSKDDEVYAADLAVAQAWGRSHLTCRARGGTFAARIAASAELPLAPLAAFQLMSHPENSAVFRGIERCTFRRILWAAAGRAAGRQTVEVENESDWHFLWFKGSIRTRMVVMEDPAAGTVHIRLAPTGGNAPLQHMSAVWRFQPGSSPDSCLMSLEQDVHPRGLPPIFFNGFRAMAALQVRRTFEDLYAEALRMNEGRPALAPYHSVAHKEMDIYADGKQEGPGGGTACSADPASVLAAAYEADSSASTAPASVERRGMVRPGGLRSHPIGSLLDLPSLAGTSSADLAAAAASHTAAEAAEQPPASLAQRAYALLQKLWVVSNAALGAAPNAVAELEEMAVLI